MKVVFTDEAERDLDAAFSYLHDQSPVAAVRLVERVFDLAGRLADGMFEGPVQVLSSGEEVRSWPMPPYRLFYQRTDLALVVLRIYHQRQRPL